MLEFFVLLQVIFSGVRLETDVTLVPFAVRIVPGHMTAQAAIRGESQMAEMTDTHFGCWKVKEFGQYTNKTMPSFSKLTGIWQLRARRDAGQ